MIRSAIRSIIGANYEQAFYHVLNRPMPAKDRFPATMTELWDTTALNVECGHYRWILCAERPDFTHKRWRNLTNYQLISLVKREILTIIGAVERGSRGPNDWVGYGCEGCGGTHG